MRKQQGVLMKVTGYMFAPLANALISFISIPIITAFFPKEISGQISLLVTYQSIIMSFALMGMDQSMSRFYYNPPGTLSNRSLTSVCCYISLISYLVISAICFLFWRNLSDAIIGRENLIIVICLVLTVLAHLVLRFLNQASRLQDNVLMYVLQSICITVSTKLSYVVTAETPSKAENAIGLITISSILTMAIFLGLKAKSTFSFVKPSTDIQIRRLLFFGLPQIPVQLLATLNNGVSQIALKYFSDYASVGIYSVAVSVSNAIALIQSGINVIWAPYVYKNYQTKQTNIIRIHHIVSLVMMCAGLVLCLFEDLMYIILVDNSYWGSKVYFPLLILSPICYTISETLGIGFKIAEKSYWNVLVYSLAFGSNAIFCCVLIPIVGPIGAAIATALSSVIMLIVKSFIGEKYYRCSDSYSKLVISFSVMCAAIIIAMVWYASLVRYFSLIFAIIIIMAIYKNEVKHIIGMLLRR